MDFEEHVQQLAVPFQHNRPDANRGNAHNFLVSLGNESSFFDNVQQSIIAAPQPQIQDTFTAPGGGHITALDFNDPPFSWVSTPFRYNNLLKGVLQSVPDDSSWNLEEELHQLSSSTFSTSSLPIAIATDQYLNVTRPSVNADLSFYLPDELLLQIFQYIAPLQASLNACAEVCRQWNRCVTPLLYYAPKFASTFHWALFIQTLLRPKRLHSHGMFVHRIDLSGRGQFNDICVSASSLIQLAFNCPKLSSLNLSGCSIFGDTFWRELREYQSMLQHVPQSDLTRVAISYKHAIHALATRCPNLQELYISGCDWVTVEVLHIIVRRFTSLKILDLTKCAKILSDNITLIHNVHYAKENETILDTILKALDT
ncbi:hypothetical protein K7432_005168 [Basidiobolus ranarum]|uniref:F-box domain-containing protein n=1 Tax=Basidiobolus ranarum TaxID=34480 RepID=A0ABR2W3M2_9FUNG